MRRKLLTELQQLAVSGKLNPETFNDVVRVVDRAFEEWRSEKQAEMRRMVDEWEQSMGPEDKTFYSLGIRRAIDVLTGRSATDSLAEQDQPSDGG